MITRADVADLRAGDVVEVTDDYLCTVRGPLRDSHGHGLWLGRLAFIRRSDGSAAQPTWSLTVVSRAPRPLYVNHDRTEPVPGDVVRDADSDDGAVWVYADAGDPRPWLNAAYSRWDRDSERPKSLRLLVNGETGQVVQ